PAPVAESTTKSSIAVVPDTLVWLYDDDSSGVRSETRVQLFAAPAVPPIAVSHRLLSPAPDGYRCTTFPGPGRPSWYEPVSSFTATSSMYRSHVELTPFTPMRIREKPLMLAHMTSANISPSMYPLNGAIPDSRSPATSV